jgi:hypothetical protein
MGKTLFFPCTLQAIWRVFMWECPECGYEFMSASAMSGPEPDCEPGIECPSCGAFIPDAEAFDDQKEQPPYE